MFSTKHAQIGKHAQSIGNWRASSNLTLLLHRRLPQHLSILPPPHQPRCNPRHHTTSTRSTHTHTHIHGTRGSQSSQSHCGVRASPISRQPVPPSALLASLPSRQPVNGEPNPAIVSNDVAGFAIRALATTFPAHTLSRSPEAPACGAERAKTYPAARHKGDRVAAYIAILCSVCKSPTRPGVVAAVAPFDIVTRLISPPSRPFPAAPASAELPLQPRIFLPPSSGPSDRETGSRLVEFHQTPGTDPVSPVNSISSRTPPLAYRPRASSPRPAGPPHGRRAFTPSASRSQQGRTGGVSRKAHCFFRRFSLTKDPPRAARHDPDGKGPAPKCSRNAPRLAWMTPAEAINSAPQPAPTTRRFGHGTCPVQPVAFARAPTQGSSVAAEQGCFVLPRCYPTHRVPQHALAARRCTLLLPTSCVNSRVAGRGALALLVACASPPAPAEGRSCLDTAVQRQWTWVLGHPAEQVLVANCLHMFFPRLSGPLVFPGSHGP